MFNKKLKMAFIYVLMVISVYLVAGNLLHRVIFPERKPDIATYFKPGQVFYSKAEGFHQKVVKQCEGHVHSSLIIEPFAAGPPVHVHADFDETFEIENGELTVLVNGEIKKLRPGEKLFIPRGVPHKPYNETGDTIRLKGAFPFPEKFAFGLTQVYSILDENPEFVNAPEALLQMALFTGAGFDSYIEGPPVIIQKAMSFVISPIARLMGYKSYYAHRDPFLNNTVQANNSSK